MARRFAALATGVGILRQMISVHRLDEILESCRPNLNPGVVDILNAVVFVVVPCMRNLMTAVD